MSRKNTVHVEVTLEQCHGDVARMIKRFSKKVKKERVIEQYLDHATYTKKSVIKSRKRRAKIRLSTQICEACGLTGHKRKECPHYQQR